ASLRTVLYHQICQGHRAWALDQQGHRAEIRRLHSFPQPAHEWPQHNLLFRVCPDSGPPTVVRAQRCRKRLVPSKSIILCVDDEPNALMLRRLVLEKAGYSVVTAPSSAEALRILSNTPVDLVLSDQLMPGGTGTDLARQVKARHPN